jgi:hypothetical protein
MTDSQTPAETLRLQLLDPAARIKLTPQDRTQEI